MASKVITLSNIANVEHSAWRNFVVLKLTGRCAGRDTRVQLELDAHDLCRVISEMRIGTDRQASTWVETQVRLNQR